MATNMTQDDFSYLSYFVSKKIGVQLSEENMYLVNSRLGTLLPKYGFSSFSEFMLNLRSLPTPQLIQDVLESLTIHETSFFRGQKTFEVILKILAEKAKSPPTKLIKIWSSATSSGQEAYSMAMLLQYNKKLLEGCESAIIATDVSKAILQKATAGIYTPLEVDWCVSSQFKSAFFTNLSNGSYQIKPEVKNSIIFKHHNLLDPFEEAHSFDVIFCRNVLYYFDEQTKTKIMRSLLSNLVSKGILVLGGTETLPCFKNEFSAIVGAEGVYQKNTPIQQ